MSSDNGDDTEHLAVSDLRSRFERLSRDHPPPVSPLRASTPNTSQEEAPKTDNSRPRKLSVNVSSLSSVPQGTQHLRTASSSSDLRRRPPPPPPPPRSPKPFLAASNAEAQQSQVEMSQTGSRLALISRVPPPPPTPKVDESTESNGSLAGGVASLRSKFGALSGSNLPSTLQGRESLRSASHSSTLSNSDVLKVQDPPRRTYSHSISNAIAASPLIKLDDDGISSSAPRLPPRLPQRGDSDSSTTSSRAVSMVSSSTDALQRPPPPPSPRKPAAPRPPPRHTSLPPTDITVDPFAADDTELSHSDSSTPTLQLPPPLPARRSPPMRATSISIPEPHEALHSAPPALERKSMGNTPFAPPPVRTIALGDKLPPARRAPNAIEGSDSDSGYEEETAVNLLPDATRASRRPPRATVPQFARANIPVSAPSGVIVAAGSKIVTAHHHIKVYDLALSDSYIHNIDLKDAGYDWRGREIKVTSACFRGSEEDIDKARFVWLGTKDGCLWEVDTASGGVTAFRGSIHGASVSSILRHGLSMITIDDNGKALIFSPVDASGGCPTMMTFTNPRVIRIAEKQGFAKVLGGMLWTSNGFGSSGGTLTNGSTPTARGPVIRTCDFLSYTAQVRSTLPSEQLGAVTSGTVMQTQPGRVFLGHEGGYISIWEVKDDGTSPVCLEAVKISVSDVMCLEGVRDRLWAGGRNGMISAYDIEHRPFVVTNSWKAHDTVPVTNLFVDPYSIENCGQLSVMSVGRDEIARFWDGLLGINWIDVELAKRESLFSSFRPLKALIVSWNVDAAKPDALTGSSENVSFLDDVLHSVDSPDIIAFGFQELIDLESRKMAAKTVFLGRKKKTEDGAISEKVSRSYKMWHDRLILAVRLAMPPDCPYTVVHTENLVGLFTCIFVKTSATPGLRDVALKRVKRGIAGMYGNKGGIVARFVVDDSSICFINCHLAAGQKHVRARNADIAGLLEEKEILPSSQSNFDPVEYAGGGDGSMVLDHEIVFLNGDLNYRIDQRRDATIAAAESGNVDQLLPHDQLLKEMKYNRGFRLRSFVEAPITFAPTYKYDRRTSVYDTSEKGRIPAWCDRILYRTRAADRVQNLHYRRYEANVSDHRPISAAFQITVKSVDHDARDRVKGKVEGQWMEEQTRLLSEARAFFVEQCFV